MIALGIVLAALLLIAFLRGGAIVEYGEGGVQVTPYIGPVRLPGKKRKEKRPNKKKEKRPGKLADFVKLIPDVITALGRLRRRLLIKRLTICYEAAAADPSAAAMAFGYANAGIGALSPILSRGLRVKRRDIRTAVSFEKTEPYIYVNAAVSLAVWEVIYIASGVLVGFLKTLNKGKENKNGQASNRRPYGDDHAENPGNG